MRQPHTTPRAVHDGGLANRQVRDVRTERMDPSHTITTKTGARMDTAETISVPRNIVAAANEQENLR